MNLQSEMHSPQLEVSRCSLSAAGSFNPVYRGSPKCWRGNPSLICGIPSILINSPLSIPAVLVITGIWFCAWSVQMIVVSYEIFNFFKSLEIAFVDTDVKRVILGYTIGIPNDKIGGCIGRKNWHPKRICL
jgi:hypothetical protein